MKQLILTFFLVILCYSLFFDKEVEKQPVMDEINYVQKEVVNPQIHLTVSNTMNYFALHNPWGGWLYEVPYKGLCD